MFIADSSAVVSWLVVLLLLIVHRGSSSTRFDRFGSLKWCSKFPDDEAREQCRATTGTLWMPSPTCCNVKFECVDGEYYQGLRCSVSGNAPGAGSSMKCVEDPSCVDTSATTTSTSTTTTTQSTTRSTTTTPTPTTSGPPTGQFCVTFPADEPPIYCTGITGPQWINSPSCCNVKFECLNEAYHQGFRCGTPGFIPDINQFRCIEYDGCVSEDANSPPDHTDPEVDPPEILCCNANEELLPHPSDCSRYAQCVSGVLTLFRCIAGTIFHYRTQQCLPGNELTCELAVL